MEDEIRTDERAYPLAGEEWVTQLDEAGTE
jgi:hypothetical protein